MKYLLGVGKVFEGNQGFDSGHHACLEYHCAFRVVKSSVCVGIYGHLIVVVSRVSWIEWWSG